MKSKENNLEKNISRLVKLAGDSDKPSEAFADSVMKNALDELKGTKAEREGNDKFVKVKWKRTLSWAAVVLVVCGIGFGILISNANKTGKRAESDLKIPRLPEQSSELAVRDKGKPGGAEFVEEGPFPDKGFAADEAYESLKVSKNLDAFLSQSEPNYNMLLAARAAKPMFMKKPKPVAISIAMSHGPVKDGLAAFLICERNQFKLDEPVPLLYGIVYNGQDESMAVPAPNPAVDPSNRSWFSITGPDGNDVPYMGVYATFPRLSPKDVLRLKRRNFHGRLTPNIRGNFKLCTPGIYTIKWHYQIGSIVGDSCWVGELVSNEIQIEILAVDDCELESSRKTLLRKDLTTRYGLWVPADDPRLKAIEQLRSAASPEAVAILREFLTAHRVNCQELKQHALVALGKIGTPSAIEAIRQFEAWSKKRFTEPPPFQLGFKDHAIDHFAPHNLTPLAKTTDEKNRTWAIFQWKRHSAVAEIWICKSLEGDLWSQPILLDLPGIPEFYPFSHTYRRWDDKCSFQVKNGSLKIVVDGQIKESRISDHLVDSDKDGVPDPVEARLLTDPRNPDSDKDGLPDGKDCNPLTPKHNDINDVTEIRQAVFSALCATGNSQDAVVIVERGNFAKQEYYGYGGVVLRSPETRNGFVNIVNITVKIESATTATATISDWESSMSASGHQAKLKKINGKWVVVEFKMTWIS